MNPIDPQSLIVSINAEYWRAIDGDHSLRLDYDLDKSSVVFDLGGYEGEWSEQIHQRYGCRILVFEPVPSFASRIAERFRSNRDVSVFELALGPKDGKLVLNLGDNATSSYTVGNGSVIEAEMKEFAGFLEQHAIREIDLLKINIEGGEFDLLDHLISSGCLSRVRYVQLQFHHFVPRAEERVQSIRERLWQTHVPTYSLDWIWDSWARATDPAARKAALEHEFRWNQQALRGMSALASGYAARNRELEGFLNEWRRRLWVLLWIRNLIRSWRSKC
jgi:FkbM family methyltransferase